MAVLRQVQGGGVIIGAASPSGRGAALIVCFSQSSLASIARTMLLPPRSLFEFQRHPSTGPGHETARDCIIVIPAFGAKKI